MPDDGHMIPASEVLQTSSNSQRNVPPSGTPPSEPNYGPSGRDGGGPTAIPTHGYDTERFREWLQARPKVEFAITVYTVILAVFAWIGLRSIMASSSTDAVERTIIPIAVALMGGIVFGVAWHYLLRNLPMIENKTTRSRMFAAAIVLSLVQSMFSALPDVTAICGSEAVNEHMADNKALAEMALAANYQAVKAQEPFIDKTFTAAAKFSAYGRNEQDHGLITGHAGHGKIAQAYLDSGTHLEAAARSMREKMDSAEATEAEGEGILRLLGGIINDPKLSPVERQRDYAKHLPDLDRVVRTLNAIDLTAQLATGGVVGGLAHASEVQRPGRQDITDLEQSVEIFGEDLRTEAKRMRKNTDLPMVPEFRGVSTMTATIEQADRHMAIVVMACALDAAPILFLFLWVCHWRDLNTVRRDAPAWGVPTEIARRAPPYMPVRDIHEFDDRTGSNATPNRFGDKYN